MSDTIVNKVAQSGLITIDLETYYKGIQRKSFDIANQLWQGIALKEKDFRQFVKEHDWSEYQNCYVNIFCSADAVIPSWAYLLLTIALNPFAKKIVFGSNDDLDKAIILDLIYSLPLDEYADGRVIIKGCSNIPHATYALVELTHLLQPRVKSLMFGEPCSTVPLYKKPKA